MARQLFALLGSLGHEVRLVSRLRARLSEPDDLTHLQLAASREIAILREDFKVWRPDLWFTYHLYYRAPDLLGPGISASFGIPYVAAEASYAAKRADGEWTHAHNLASGAIARADLLIALTERDAKGLETFADRTGQLLRLKPFLA
ncbi:MAG: glycosyltransferase family 4 protein, partial [Bosea sp. (in: a-proteobacteria)]